MKKFTIILTVLAAVVALGFVQPTYAVGTINGAVIDADQNGVSGAVVMVMGMQQRRGQRPYMARAESGENGVFVFENVPAGRYVVSAMTRDLGGARAEAAVEDGGATRVVLQLQGHRGGGGGGGEEGEVVMTTATVTVIDAEGNPVEGARVVAMPARMAHRRGGARVRPVHGVTDANGVCILDPIAVGNWVITAGKRDVGMGRTRAELGADQENPVEITLQQR